MPGTMRSGAPFVCLVAAILSSWDLAASQAPAIDTLLNTASIETSDKIFDFSQRLAEQILSGNRDKSVVFSPLSVNSALRVLLLGSRGNTYHELSRLLFGDNPSQSAEATHNDFSRLIGQLVASNSDLSAPEVGHYVSVANAMFVQNGVSLRPSYQTVVQSVYRADTFMTDLHSPEALEQINKWVSESTRGKIREILTKPLDSRTRVLIASSIYYNAKWKTTFYERMSRLRPFWPEGKDQPSFDVEMMALGGTLPFADWPELDCRILGLPYKDSVSTMYIVMPNNSSSQAVRRLHSSLNSNVINQMIRRMTMQTSIVFLPKMQLTATLELHKELRNLGVTSLFDPNSADLGLITDTASGVAQFAPPPAVGAGFGVRPQVMAVPETSFKQNLEDVLIFSRFNEEEMHKMDESPSASRPKRKRSLRHRRQADNSLRALEQLRNQLGAVNPGLFANEIVHKVDLTVNEKGTEGGAATVVFLHKTGTSVVFKAEEPFIFFIRHEASQLPLFYGAVFDPRP